MDLEWLYRKAKADEWQRRQPEREEAKEKQKRLDEKPRRRWERITLGRYGEWERGRGRWKAKRERRARREWWREWRRWLAAAMAAALAWCCPCAIL